MNNNKLKAISMAGSKRKREFFNLSCDNTSTFGFGELQPTFVHPMLADSKMVMDTESLIRLAPMNVPTFGRLKLKTYSQFVPITDIFPCFNEFLAKTRFTYGSATYIPGRVPSMSLGVLSLMCFAGCDFQIWVRTSQGTGSGQWLLPNTTKWNSDYRAAFESYFGNVWYYSTHTYTTSWILGLDSPSAVAKIFLGDKPLQSLSEAQYLNIMPVAPTVVSKIFDDGGEPRVDIANCDEVVTHSVTYNGVAYTFGVACNLSGFGKRIRKFLIGSGYQVNVNSTRSVSLLPLFASYKAYFDLFNLPQWANFEDTYLKKYISSLLVSGSNLSGDHPNSSQSWRDFTLFIGELAMSWYTAPQEFISAHQQNTKNAGGVFGISSFLDVGTSTTLGAPAAPNISTFNTQESDTNKNPDARITNAVHTQLDSELLKRIYKWVNRNSILGKRVAEILRIQGYQDYVDSCKSNYIGSFEVPIRINDVVSQADTYNNTQTDGKLLGEYGARGLGYGETREPLVYETKEMGYWVTLATIVPDSGYGQAIDPSILPVVKEEFYSPEFDGLGMEASPKLLVCAAEDYTVPSAEQSTQGSLDATFGYVPRYSGLKVINNKLNGDISLRSMRNQYSPYTLDKLIYVNEINPGSGATSSVGYVRNYTVNDFGPAQLPIAGNVWRYPTRYGWLGNLHRIFADVGVNDKNPTYFNYGLFTEVTNPSNDNFITQTVFNVRYYAPMLKIEDSYETNDEGNEGKATTAITKA